MSSYKNECDKRLVELTLHGDNLAFAELVIRHEKAALGTAYKIMHDYQKAEDAAQEAFVAAWIQLRALTAQDKFRAYVCAIAKNCAKKMMMREYLLPTVSLTDFENHEFDNDGPSEAIYATQDDMGDRLREGTDSLSEPLRETIRLHYFEGLSVKEIAARLDIPEGTVKWRLSEGRKQLQKGFGIMDYKKYIEKSSLTDRVMNRIQELELCQMKNTRQGLSEAYQAALEAVEELPENEKAYMLAEILCRGIQYQKPNDAFMSKWKQAILDGHNDMMMCQFTSWENHHLNGQEKIDYMREVQIPFLREHNFSLSIGYVYLMMAFEYFWEQKYEEALETVRQAKELLEPTSDYYANAVSAISVWEKMLAVPESLPTTRGEHIKMIDGSLYYCENPGIIFEDTRLRDFSRCDSLIFDAGISLGESKVSSCGYVTYTFTDEKKTVETPAGVFENCRVYEVKEEFPGRGSILPYSYHSTLFFCRGIGLVCQYVETNDQKGKESRRYLLSEYDICGGEGWFPLCKGNSWAYTDVWNETHTSKYDAYYEVTSWNGTDAMLAAEEILIRSKPL